MAEGAGSAAKTCGGFFQHHDRYFQIGIFDPLTACLVTSKLVRGKKRLNKLNYFSVQIHVPVTSPHVSNEKNGKLSICTSEAESLDLSAEKNINPIEYITSRYCIM